MTEQDLINAITLAVPKDKANADAIAKAMLTMAVARVGRLRNVSFNRQWVEFQLTAGDGSYKIGTEVMQKYPTITNVQELYMTDQTGSPIRMISLDEFNRHARGGTSTGRPTIGTIHSTKPVLEVYPIPDSAYTVGCYAKVSISQLKDIPEQYHDIVYSTAALLIAMSGDPGIAIKVTRDGLEELMSDALIGWNGTVIEAERTVQGSSIAAKPRSSADSHNLTGV